MVSSPAQVGNPRTMVYMNVIGYKVIMKSPVKTPNQQTNHTLNWMSFRGNRMQAPKVPHLVLTGALLKGPVGQVDPTAASSTKV